LLTEIAVSRINWEVEQEGNTDSEERTEEEDEDDS
jgi:hypothetical protein